MEKILSAEEFREQTGHILKGTNHFAEMYAKYLLKKQAEYIREQFKLSGASIINEASNEFIKNIEL